MTSERDMPAVAEIVRKLLDKEAVTIDFDKDLYELGLTSIMVLPLLVELETSFRIIIPDTEFMEARTIRALACLIGQLRGRD